MRILLIAAFWLAAAGSVSAEPARYIVGFVSGTDEARRSEILDRVGMKSVAGIDELGIEVVEAKSASSGKAAFKTAAMSLMAAEGVYYVEEDFYINWLNGAGASFQARPMPSLGAIMEKLPKFEKTDAGSGEAPWGIVRVNAQGAWGKTRGRGVKVAVVDTGIDYSHPDLKDNYAGGYNALDKKKPPMDDQGHGTHVAGTIGAVKDGKGVVGVAPEVRLYAVKVLDKDGGGRLTSIIKGLIWCANNRMDVANMSLGAPIGTVFMRLAVKYAKAKGVTVVAAAGNSGGDVGYPAGYPDAIAVSASDSKDKIASFSSRGDEVDFIAPGVDVKSTLPGGTYGRYSGTSMATPHVSGLAAIAVARGARGLDQVKAALTHAAKPLTGLGATEQGRGMIDAGGM